MKLEQIKAGVWIYGLATVATGVLDVVWRKFEGSHQPFKALGANLPGEHVLAILAGIWLIAAGIAMLWRRTARAGAAAAAVMYVIFALFWVARLFAMVHAIGYRVGVIVFGLGQGGEQWLLAAGALLVYVATAAPDSRWRARGVIAARLMLGLPPIAFGLGHLVSLRGYVPFVPHWMPFARFWVVLAGTAFLLAGSAIVSGVRDVLAARMLALMFFLFELMVEIPPIFAHPRSQGAWGGAVYNLTAIGVCWIFAELAGGRLIRQHETDFAEYCDAVHAGAAAE